MTFVAIKRRPSPEVCGVGSYVELSPDAAVETLARRALDALDFRGIAEVEILRDEDSGRDYLIEINARPWVQYALGPASGHDLLSFMFFPDRHDPRRAATSGRRWLDLSADAYYCFSRTVGLVRDGRIPFRTYLSSVLRANTLPIFRSRSPPRAAISGIGKCW
jgi:predicted ATP-grasp superfamily ATP-dependent carboligase